MVFVTCTPAVAARLALAPGVAGIGPDAEIDVALDGNPMGTRWEPDGNPMGTR